MQMVAMMVAEKGMPSVEMMDHKKVVRMDNKKDKLKEPLLVDH